MEKQKNHQILQLVLMLVILAVVLLISTFSEKITIVTPKAVTQETTQMVTDKKTNQP